MFVKKSNMARFRPSRSIVDTEFKQMRKGIMPVKRNINISATHENTSYTLH